MALKAGPSPVPQLPPVNPFCMGCISIWFLEFTLRELEQQACSRPTHAGLKSSPGDSDEQLRLRDSCGPGFRAVETSWLEGSTDLRPSSLAPRPMGF